MDRRDPPAQLDLLITDAEHEIAVRAFAALWRGERPRPADIGADPAAVAALEPRGLVTLDAERRITGMHGLSAIPTRHRITHDHGTIHTWCAFDALGIPAALGLDAVSRTSCPTCGRELEATFGQGQPDAAPELRLWLPLGRCDHVIDDLCANANLYCDEQHLADHVPGTATGSVLDVAESARLGRTTWRDAAATGVHR